MHSPDPAEAALGTVGMCLIPAGAGRLRLGNGAGFHPQHPVLPSCQQHRGWDLAFPGWGAAFAAFPGHIWLWRCLFPCWR